MKRKQKYFRIKFSYPDYGIFMGKQLIGEMKRKIPANRQVIFKKYSKYENVHHRKGCEKLTDNFCMEPKLIKPYQREPAESLKNAEICQKSCVQNTDLAGNA